MNSQVVPSDLSLSPLDSADLTWFVGVRNSVREFLHDPRAFTSEEAAIWFAMTSPDIRVISAGGSPVGYFRLRIDDEDPESLWVGADIDPQHQGNGIGRIAYEYFLPRFAAEFNAKTFRLRVLPGNYRAIRLYLSLGFRTIQLERSFDSDGRSVILSDCLMERNAHQNSTIPTANDPLSFISPEQ